MPLNSALQVRWLTNPGASCFYAAEAVWRELRVTDKTLVAALEEPVSALAAAVAWDFPVPDLFWVHVGASAARQGGDADIARNALTKALGRDRAEPLVNKYRNLFVALRTAFNPRLPNLNDLAPVDETFLPEQWSRFGLPLLAEMVRDTDAGLLVSEADIALVHPLLGGGGTAHHAYNLVRIEAVAADPRPGMPEILRLAWLVASLNLDLPRYCDLLGQPRTCVVGGRALIPVALAAGQELGLASCNEAGIRAAVQAWLPAETRGNLDGRLFQWWEVYKDTRPDWVTALGALHQLLIQ